MSRARLARLQALADAGDAELAAWLGAGLARWRAGEPLEKALDLTGERARNAALLRAARLLDPQGTLGAWRTARLLARAVARFERSWPRQRFAAELPRDSIDAAIAESFHASDRRLSSARKLYDLIKPDLDQTWVVWSVEPQGDSAQSTPETAGAKAR